MLVSATLKGRILLVLTVSAILIATTLLVAPSAQARVGSCPADPKVWLSDGTKITVKETIGVDKASISGITYVFHLPLRVTVAKIVKSDTGIANKEVISFLYDAPANTYKTDLVVKVKSGTAGVSASMSVKKSSTTVSGVTGHVISMSVYSK